MTSHVQAALTYDGYSAADLARECEVPRVGLLADTTSTLDVAHELAARGAPAGTLVVADSQSAGRGRLGRAWVSAPARGVWCTLVERPTDVIALDVLSIRVGMAVALRLDAIAGETVGVKWPNDLVLRAGKVGGILTEARWSGATLAWVAIGVGVNVQAPDGVVGAAGLPAGVQRIDVLAAIVAGIREAASRSGYLDAAELNAFQERDILPGHRLSSPASGVADGIAADGALIIRTASGVEHHRAGTVRFSEKEGT